MFFVGEILRNILIVSVHQNGNTFTTSVHTFCCKQFLHRYFRKENVNEYKYTKYNLCQKQLAQPCFIFYRNQINIFSQLNIV